MVSHLMCYCKILYRYLQCGVCVVAYKDLKDRKETRQLALEQPGWDECVRRTGVWCVCHGTTCELNIQKSVFHVTI